MDNWQQEWTRFWETLVDEADQFLMVVAQEINDVTAEVVEFSDEMTEQLNQAIAPALEQLDLRLEEWSQPLLYLMDQADDLLLEATTPFDRTIEPLVNQHPVCVGCRHYHGKTYGDTMLVCAMHPYGVDKDQDTCPDKEVQIWSQWHERD